MVERAVALNTSGVFGIEEEEIQSAPASPKRGVGQLLTLAEVEQRYVREVLEAVGGNISRAAEILGIDRRTLYRKLERVP